VTVDSNKTETAVIGAGVIGLATTLALSDAGADVVCLEAGRPGGGQSAGETRIFRHRHDDDRLIVLAAEARKYWLAWEARGSRELLGREGVLRFGDDIENAHRRLRRARIAAELLAPDEQARALPAIVGPAPKALFEPGGGAIRARRTIELLVEWLDKRIVRAQVLGIERVPRGLRILTSEGIWGCKRAVICAGAGTPALAGALGITIPTHLACHPRITFVKREAHRDRRFACLQDGSGAHGETVYGAPCGGSGRYVVGLVGADSDAECDPRTGMVADDIDTRIGRIRSYVSRALPGLAPTPISVRLCHTTKLAAGKDAFGAWAEDSIVAIAGNNLFKFAPVLGRLLAKAAINGLIPTALPRPVAARSATRGQAGPSNRAR
jgi:sarcosine oxidase